MKLVCFNTLSLVLAVFIYAVIIPHSAHAEMTLEEIYVSDYVTYSHISLELSNTRNAIKVQPLPAARKIRVHLHYCSRGDMGSVYQVNSAIIDDIRLSRDSTQRWLYVDIPVNQKADFNKIHWHRWSQRVTLDIPLNTPNHSHVPPKDQIAAFKRQGGKVVVIDAGHGGHDGGTKGGRYTRHPRLQEKELVLEMSRYLKNLIDQDPQLMGLMTRSGDYLPVPFGVEGTTNRQYIRESLRYRVQLAKEYDGDIYVSLHLNAIVPQKQRSIRGFMVFTLGDSTADKLYEDTINDTALHDEGMTLAAHEQDQQVSQVVSALMKDTVTSNSQILAAHIADEMRKVPGLQMNSNFLRQFPYLVLRQLNMPSVLVEFLYLTHPVEHEFIRKEANRRRLVDSLYQAIRNYFPRIQTNPVFAMHNNQTAQPAVQTNDASNDPLKQTLEQLHTARRGDTLEALQQVIEQEIQNHSPHQIADGAASDSQSEEQSADTQDTESHAQEAVQQEAPPEPYVYTIQHGDTLNSIAKAFGCTVQELRTLNGLNHGHIIHPSQTLKIPNKGTKIPDHVNPAPVYIDHEVKRGDTLHLIAKKYNTTISSIRDLNQLRSDIIRPGDTLTIHRGYKNGERITSQVEKYKVRKGDTLSEIADKYGVSVHQIRSSNGIRGSRIHPGQILRIDL